MKTLISGSHGLIGSALLDSFPEDGEKQFRLVRKSEDLKENEIFWDPEENEIEDRKLEGFDAVVHLAGEPIADGRWSEDKKQRIRDSRVNGTHLLCEALANRQSLPAVFISASAMGYYGDRGAENLTEKSPKGKGFLADVCEDWERATGPLKKKGVRVVNIRTGMVLSSEGGALSKMLPVFKLGLGGKLGSGSQIMSWISLVDHIGAIRFLIKNANTSGPVNLVSPNPVTNKRFTETLGIVLGRPTFWKVPGPVLKIMLGEMAEEVLLVSARGIPSVLKDEGFQFQYPHLKEALEFHLGEG